MIMDDFRKSLLSHFDKFGRTLATDAGDWVVKGFIDAYRNIYTISERFHARCIHGLFSPAAL